MWDSENEKRLLKNAYLRAGKKVSKVQSLVQAEQRYKEDEIRAKVLPSARRDDYSSVNKQNLNT